MARFIDRFFIFNSIFMLACAIFVVVAFGYTTYFMSPTIKEARSGGLQPWQVEMSLNNQVLINGDWDMYVETEEATGAALSRVYSIDYDKKTVTVADPTDSNFNKRSVIPLTDKTEIHYTRKSDKRLSVLNKN